MTKFKFKPCGCGWVSEKEYAECEDHAEIRKRLAKLENQDVHYSARLRKYFALQDRIDLYETLSEETLAEMDSIWYKLTDEEIALIESWGVNNDDEGIPQAESKESITFASPNTGGASTWMGIPVRIGTSEPEIAVCPNCNLRPGTETWVGNGGPLALIHGCSAQWCKQCCLEAQVEYAEAAVERLPGLKKQLAELLEEEE